ncbi:MAG: alpha-ribazole phosphatase [Promethearchaeota archaeon]
MEIYLIRHTKTNLKEGICYGQSDVDVANTFDIESESVCNKLLISKKMVFYSSSATRCIKLAKKLSLSDPIIDNRLLELNFGDWELKRWDSINQSQLKAWTDDFIVKSCPNGESYIDLYQRTTEFFNELIKKDHESLVIITHSGVIRAIISYILQIPLKNSFSIQIDHGGLSKIKVIDVKDSDPTFILEFFNR